MLHLAPDRSGSYRHQTAGLKPDPEFGTVNRPDVIDFAGNPTLVSRVTLVVCVFEYSADGERRAVGNRRTYSDHSSLGGYRTERSPNESFGCEFMYLAPASCRGYRHQAGH
jgi:hypothetical protein